jgi:hypothetical protein
MKQRLISLVTTPRAWCALALGLAAGVAHADFDGSFAYGWSMSYSLQHATTWGCKHVPDTCALPGHGQGAQSSPRARAAPAPRGSSVASLDTGKALSNTRGIEQLAATFPAQNRQEATQTFTALILEFNKLIPRTYGIPANNMATAYAAILAGGYAAYTNKPFPEEAVKALYRQAEQSMLSRPNMARLSMDDKNTQYQIWVGTAAFMLGWQSNLSKKPNPEQQAKMQKVGAEILHSLGVDPDKVRFTKRGMEFD